MSHGKPMSGRRVLVVGGAGYIGSHMVLELLEQGCEVVVLDNLSGGHRDAVPEGVTFIEGNLGDAALLDRVFTHQKYDAVMHFGAHIEVGESVRDPGKYYENNFSNTCTLIRAMTKHGVSNFIFSSTAAVFGEPEYVPIDEAHSKRPINPYGRSKLMVEEMLADFETAYPDFRYIANTI